MCIGTKPKQPSMKLPPPPKLPPPIPAPKPVTRQQVTQPKLLIEPGSKPDIRIGSSSAPSSSSRGTRRSANLNIKQTGGLNL